MTGAGTLRAALQAGPRAQQSYGRCSSLTDAQLDRVIAHVGDDLELAEASLRMRPWPSWMRGVLFPGRTSTP